MRDYQEPAETEAVAPAKVDSKTNNIKRTQKIHRRCLIHKGTLEVVQ